MGNSGSTEEGARDVSQTEGTTSGRTSEGAASKTKTKSRTKQRSNRMPGPNCYLTFSPSTGGMLFNQWSVEEVPGALAVMTPGPEVNVPAFKAKQNGGRSEIIRDINGPRWNGTSSRVSVHMLRLIGNG